MYITFQNATNTLERIHRQVVTCSQNTLMHFNDFLLLFFFAYHKQDLIFYIKKKLICETIELTVIASQQNQMI